MDKESRFVVAKGEVGGGRMEWEFGISRWKLLYTKGITRSYCVAWRTNNTENYIQYPMKNHNGKDYF